jgi:hypothetical protein
MEKGDKKELSYQYSDLPLTYVECADYDSMGNHGRFPVKPKNKEDKQKKFLFSFKKRKNE